MTRKSAFKIVLLSFLFFFVTMFTNAQKEVSKFKKIKELSNIEEYIYTPNNLNILLLQDNSAPVVTVQMVYRVGSKHEVTGNTGSTHLLEHLNFKGTPTFNKRNGNAIFSTLQGIGARMNATTWKDRTNYYETIPSDKLELALHIESDRMRNSLLLKEDKDAEMTVVRNEFERNENNPNSLLSKEIWATAYMAHPYHHPTLGWRSDIENMPIEVLRDFYNTYYWPDNATLTIIGDFQKDQLFNLIDTYFGKITKAPHTIPQPYTMEPEQLGPRKITIKKPGQQGVISLAYKIPGRLHKDLPALHVLVEILGIGPSSIINKTFVDTGLANYGYAGTSNFKEVGLFTINLGFRPDKSYDELNDKMLNMIEKVKNEGVSQDDVNRIVAKLNAKTILSRDGSGAITSQLNEAIAVGDWTDYIYSIEKFKKVTSEDVKRVANTYLKENQSTTGYFLPQVPGANKPQQEKASNFIQKTGAQHFRDTELSEHDCHESLKFKSVYQQKFSETLSAYNTKKSLNNSQKFIRKEVAGIDVIVAKTGVKDFLTVNASFPIDDYLNSKKNEAVPNLTVKMLSKGTTKNDKFQFSKKFEKLGAFVSISTNNHHVNIGFRCLSKDIKEVIDLLAEELRYPLFDAKEFKLLKQQTISSARRSLTSTNRQGKIALSQSIYPKDHPNYTSSVEDYIKTIKEASLEDLKAFHKTYFGPKGMHLVAVGDVDTNNLYSALKSGFKGWNGGITTQFKYQEPSKSKAVTKVITIPKKPSAEIFIGQYTGLNRSNADFLPFYIGTSILGGGFGRLMQTVRDNDGLTYSIGARHDGHDYAGGHWVVNASFNPSLFQKGLDATMEQIEKWAKEGITEEELAAKKTNLMGSFKVGLSTTGGLASAIMSVVKRGLDPDYINQYPKDIDAVTLDQVNNAIKKYANLNKLIIIKSGSLDQNGKPLK
ncbi:insulinase family protein [Polaribacter batillariae]|uniref:Insulinase family protein n=1 Tax=Polaribacter batillariae TaxID=2808900 RepID=A0ABX7SVP4_9FLAO|nr:pitrilysin family protein [Polaribacter batillariae]QTD36913.1 insulinase family protein [Polaribacter batillariae]